MTLRSSCVARRAVLELATALSALTPAAVSAAAAQSGVIAHLHNQLVAAGLAMKACMDLGAQLELASPDAFRLAAAAQLLLQASLPLLPLLTAVTCSAHQTEAHRQVAVHALAAYCFMTVAAITEVCTALLERPAWADAAAAFAGSTARPAVLLPWLQAVAQALLALPAAWGDCEQGGPSREWVVW